MSKKYIIKHRKLNKFLAFSGEEYYLTYITDFSLLKLVSFNNENDLNKFISKNKEIICHDCQCEADFLSCIIMQEGMKDYICFKVI